MSQFLRAVKSTVDKIVNGLAVGLGVPYIDIDDKSKIRLLTDSSQTAMLGHFQTLPKTSDRIYSGSFGVGVKLSVDPGNYTLLGMLDTVSDAFPVGAQVFVKDWSGVTPGATLGRMVIRQTGLQANEEVGDANVRFIQVEIDAVQYV
jgi:hypothetical protein